MQDSAVMEAPPSTSVMNTMEMLAMSPRMSSFASLILHRDMLTANFDAYQMQLNRIGHGGLFKVAELVDEKERDRQEQALRAALGSLQRALAHTTELAAQLSKLEKPKNPAAPVAAPKAKSDEASQDGATASVSTLLIVYVIGMVTSILCLGNWLAWSGTTLGGFSFRRDEPSVTAHGSAAAVNAPGLLERVMDWQVLVTYMILILLMCAAKDVWNIFVCWWFEEPRAQGSVDTRVDDASKDDAAAANAAPQVPPPAVVQGVAPKTSVSIVSADPATMKHE